MRRRGAAAGICRTLVVMKSVILAAAFATFVACAQKPDSKPASAQKQEQVKEETTPQVDPVCGMTIEPKTAEGKFAYKGKMYYFCSKDDQQEFQKSPDQYVKKK